MSKRIEKILNRLFDINNEVTFLGGYLRILDEKIMDAFIRLDLDSAEKLIDEMRKIHDRSVEIEKEVDTLIAAYIAAEMAESFGEGS